MVQIQTQHTSDSQGGVPGPDYPFESLYSTSLFTLLT